MQNGKGGSAECKAKIYRFAMIFYAAENGEREERAKKNTAQRTPAKHPFEGDLPTRIIECQQSER